MRRPVHLPPRGEPRGGAVPAGSWRPPLASPRASYSGSCSSSRSSVGRGAGCGQVNAKILGGQEAEDGKWPWQVSVRIRGKHVCGGSLITQQWVLTAGHCILSRFHYNVKMGDRSVYKEITSVVVPVRDIIVHPQLSVVGTIQKDLALLQLLYPVNFTMTIQPICIPQKTFRVEAGTTCWVTSWGRKEEYGGDLITSVLHEVDQGIIHHEKCNEMIQKAMKTTRDVVLEGMLCGYKGTGKDSCQAAAVTPVDPGSYRAAAIPQPAAKSPFPAGCGHRSMRIVGGIPAPERKWPWQVSLQIKDKHTCGGSLIASRWVLTAAHCILGHVEYTVKMGDVHVNHTSRMAIQVPVRDIVIHKYYNPVGSIENDIALILLEFPVNFSSHIQPVCLPEKMFMVEAGMECWVTGWGKRKETDKPEDAPEQLQEAKLNVVRYEECNRALKEQMESGSDLVKKGAVCGYSSRGKDTCQGDSGGPMACEFNETWVQVGIVSWGFGCGRRNFPGVYTEVSFYKDWVIDHLSQACCWDSADFFILLCVVLPLGILVAP
ncbi:serine protease 44 isoform X3 [Felis catus]|uniref:serine protease 44 isoform X3 n=1 Tax=Felis catus TaxID=9685 RepID=UPI001D1A2C95|nr:serine protease 44 isoform X3 [Felis catus]